MMRKELRFLSSVLTKSLYLRNTIYPNSIFLLSISSSSSDILTLLLFIVHSIIPKQTIKSTLTSPQFLCNPWNRVSLSKQYSYFMKFSFFDLMFSFNHTTKLPSKHNSNLYVNRIAATMMIKVAFGGRLYGYYIDLCVF